MSTTSTLMCSLQSPVSRWTPKTSVTSLVSNVKYVSFCSDVRRSEGAREVLHDEHYDDVTAKLTNGIDTMSSLNFIQLEIWHEFILPHKF